MQCEVGITLCVGTESIGGGSCFPDPGLPFGQERVLVAKDNEKLLVCWKISRNHLTWALLSWYCNDSDLHLSVFKQWRWRSWNIQNLFYTVGNMCIVWLCIVKKLPDPEFFLHSGRHTKAIHHKNYIFSSTAEPATHSYKKSPLIVVTYSIQWALVD